MQALQTRHTHTHTTHRIHQAAVTMVSLNGSSHCYFYTDITHWSKRLTLLQVIRKGATGAKPIFTWKTARKDDIQLFNGFSQN